MSRTIIAPPQAYGERRIGRVNWLGVWTLYFREVHRFLKVFAQTIVAPAVNPLLFMAIFSLIFSGTGRGVAGVPFNLFLAPGLIAMTIIQNAFANTVSSVLISKMQGNIIDVLMPPLSPGELTFAFAMGGVTRGLIVSLVVSCAIWIFTPMGIAHWGFVIFYAFMGSLLFSLVGIMTGIWADKFDHAATITNFIIMPLSFLSGTFYSIERLPEVWQTFSHFNPFFYFIDGFRYGFIDRADSNIIAGIVITITLDAALWVATYLMFKTGYKLRT